MVKRVRVAAAVIKIAEQILIAKRPLDKHQGGLWEFPGGKIEAGEKDIDALSRELLEEINIQIKDAKLMETISFDYSDKQVELNFYLVSQFSGKPKGLEGQQVTWVAIKDLADYQFPEANLPIVKQLISLI